MKKHSKRILVALLAAAMVLNMTACSQEPGDEPSSSEPESSVSEQASEPEPSDPEVEEEPGSDAEAEAETETSEPAAEEPGSSADTGSSTASQPATDTTTSQPAANQGSTSSQAPAAQAQQPAANSQSQAPASQNQSQSTSTPPATQASSGKGPLAKYTVNVTDPDTPATHVVGTTINGKDAYYFYSSSDKIVGNIPMDYIAQIIRENGLSYAELDEQKAWFVENFNIYRGLDGGEYESSSGSSGSSGSSNSSEIDIDEFREELIRLTNKEREDAGLEPFDVDADAMEYAQLRAEEISESFAHKRPNGDSSSMYGSCTYGENIAKGYTTPEAAINGWMNSDGHRRTMMGDYSDYGNRFGVGVYKKNGTIYWTQEFVAYDSEY